MFTPRRPQDDRPDPCQPEAKPLPGPGASMDEISDWVRSRLSPEARAALEDPSRPDHGEPGHVCGVEELTGTDLSGVIDMVADNLPLEWVLMRPDDRGREIAAWREHFLSSLRKVAADADRLTPDGEIPKWVLVMAMATLSEGKGRPPKLLLDAVGLSLADFDPALVAQWEGQRAAYMENLRRSIPGVEKYLPKSDVDDSFAELVKDAVPDDKVLIDGRLIPKDLAEKNRAREIEAMQGDAWSADNPLNLSLGANPFVVIEMIDVGLDGLRQMEIHVGGGAETVSKSSAILEAALREIFMRAQKKGDGPV